jgi:NADH:ubiquinone oxidoreductase subunit
MAKKMMAKPSAKTAKKTVVKKAVKAAPKAAARATRREWTKDDLRELKRLVKENTPARSIAATMERSEGAVRQKAFAAGFSFRKRTASARRK